MKPGISSACLYPMESEKSIGLLLRLGFRCFEFFSNTESELTDSFLDAVREQLSEAGAAVYSLHPYTSGFEPVLFFSGYRRRFEDGVRQYIRYFRAARRIGAKVVVFHGDFAAGSIGEDEYFRRFGILSGAAEGEGVVLAQENVSRCRSRSVRFIRHMHEYLGENVKFVFDFKQVLRAEENLFEMLGAMGKNIVNVHISDSCKDNAGCKDNTGCHDIKRDCLLPGCGTMDFLPALRLLEKNGYSGPLMIEVYRDSFHRPEELMQSLNYVTGKCDEIRQDSTNY